MNIRSWTAYRSNLPLLLLLATVAPASVHAQDMGHAGMQMPMPLQPEQKRNPAKRVTAPQGEHEHHPMPRSANQPSLGQPVPQMPGMPSMTVPMGKPANASASAEPRTPIPVLTDADRAAAVPPPSDHPVHDNTIQNYTVFDRLEGWDADAGVGVEWEGESWIGTDRNRLWLRSEGERRNDRTEEADLELLYGHSVSAWWDVVAGLRHDFKPGTSQDFAAIGLMGVAPYKFEVAATAYVGQSGQTGARLEAQYETLFTNRLILQPLIEANFYGQNDLKRGTGSGLSSIEAGLRLRYEVTRRFAPYVGVIYEHAFGRSADFRRAEGEDINETRLVAGIRVWF